jgi:hypothetical protein
MHVSKADGGLACRGEPVFDISATKLFLRADVEAGKHLTMTPLQFLRTQREYSPFDTKKKGNTALSIPKSSRIASIRRFAVRSS